MQAPLLQLLKLCVSHHLVPDLIVSWVNHDGPVFFGVKSVFNYLLELKQLLLFYLPQLLVLLLGQLVKGALLLVDNFPFVEVELSSLVAHEGGKFTAFFLSPRKIFR